MIDWDDTFRFLEHVLVIVLLAYYLHSIGVFV